MPETADLATRHTLEFVAAHLPSAACRVLEVGCGHGRLARELVSAGHTVAAIDSDPEAVAECRQRGVSAIEAVWPAYEGGPFDAILFTRSLHHIEPLDGAVKHAAELLCHQGRVIVEDFDFLAPDAASVAWLCSTGASMAARGRIQPPADGLLARLLGSPDPLQEWRRHHADHGVHTGAAVRAAVARRLRITHEEQAPYLCRNLVGAAHPTLSDDSLAEAMQDERGLIERGRIRAIGRRLVATTPAPS